MRSPVIYYPVPKVAGNINLGVRNEFQIVCVQKQHTYIIFSGEENLMNVTVSNMIFVRCLSSLAVFTHLPATIIFCRVSLKFSLLNSLLNSMKTVSSVLEFVGVLIYGSMS